MFFKSISIYLSLYIIFLYFINYKIGYTLNLKYKQTLPLYLILKGLFIFCIYNLIFTNFKNKLSYKRNYFEFNFFKIEKLVIILLPLITLFYKYRTYLKELKTLNEINKKYKTLHTLIFNNSNQIINFKNITSKISEFQNITSLKKDMYINTNEFIKKVSTFFIETINCVSIDDDKIINNDLKNYFHTFFQKFEFENRNNIKKKKEIEIFLKNADIIITITEKYIEKVDLLLQIELKLRKLEIDCFNLPFQLEKLNLNELKKIKRNSMQINNLKNKFEDWQCDNLIKNMLLYLNISSYKTLYEKTIKSREQIKDSFFNIIYKLKSDNIFYKEIVSIFYLELKKFSKELESETNLKKYIEKINYFEEYVTNLANNTLFIYNTNIDYNLKKLQFYHLLSYRNGTMHNKKQNNYDNLKSLLNKTDYIYIIQKCYDQNFFNKKIIFETDITKEDTDIILKLNLEIKELDQYFETVKLKEIKLKKSLWPEYCIEKYNQSVVDLIKTFKADILLEKIKNANNIVEYKTNLRELCNLKSSNKNQIRTLKNKHEEFIKYFPKQIKIILELMDKYKEQIKIFNEDCFENIIYSPYDSIIPDEYTIIKQNANFLKKFLEDNLKKNINSKQLKDDLNKLIKTIYLPPLNELKKLQKQNRIKITTNKDDLLEIEYIEE